jgi:hypothetical protein
MSGIGAFGSQIKEKLGCRGMLSSMTCVSIIETLDHFKPQSNNSRVSNLVCLSIRLLSFNRIKWLTLKEMFSLLRYNCAEQLIQVIDMEGAETGNEDAPEDCLGSRF